MVVPHLLVVRVSELEASRRWYETLGLAFEIEQHGNGPEHYAADHGGFVFELYPATHKMPASASVRLGFTVSDVAGLAATMDPSGYLVSGPSIQDGSLRAVLRDPDGIRSRLSGMGVSCPPLETRRRPGSRRAFPAAM